MSDAFISYRRKPSAALANLIQRELRSRHRIDAYLDTTRTDSTRVQFPERLMNAISNTPTFICLLTDSTLESKWVRKEIQKAYELKKHCIPVFQENYVPSIDNDEAVEYLLNFDGVNILDIKNIYIDQAIANIAALIVRRKSPIYFRLAPVLIMVFVVIGLGLYWTQMNTKKDDGIQKTLSSSEFVHTENIDSELTITSIVTALKTDTPDISYTNTTIVPTNTDVPITIDAGNSRVLNCKGVDFTFLVDQSTSMLTNDPDNLRLQAIKEAIQAIYENAYIECEGNITHTASIISFGSEVVTSLPSVEIGGYTDDWTSDLAHTLAFLRPLDLGTTDPLLAFAEVLENDNAMLNRKRHIIMITDGIPCTLEASTKNLCTSHEWVKEYFFGDPEEASADGIGFIDFILQNFSTSHNTLDVMFFADDPVFQEVDEAWTQLTEAYGGVYLPPENLYDLTSITDNILSIIDRAVINQGIVCSASFLVPPETINFTLTGYGDKKLFSLIQPNDSIVDFSGNNVDLSTLNNNDHNIIRIVIERPEIGLWQLNSASNICNQWTISYELDPNEPMVSRGLCNEKIDANFINFEEGLLARNITPNVAPPYYSPDENAVARFQIFNKDILDSCFDNPFITFCGLVFNAYKDKEIGCVLFHEEADGIYLSDVHLPAPGSGNHELRVIAEMSFDSGETTELFVIKAQYSVR